ncbi:hypothetical protein Phi13:1_gp097 [Cellulophaga phage phi13:1]|uniref:Uncharacterized protein n=1 Tax=Cellulophaga phage phi13:1 TaxID=1327992 RepID=S0A4F4_9CAUD|nr:hypothetical protein Phi13:1_gp097 [Cellulophaga phage phi13:1]
MKLELKDLACYLPYDLKIKTGDYIRTLSISVTTTTEISLSNVLCDVGYKPILRPLSDLTKEIEIDDEYYVISEEYHYLRFDEISNYKGGSDVLRFIQAREQDILLEWHFDIFGLIEKGLAIDINTLND